MNTGLLLLFGGIATFAFLKTGNTLLNVTTSISDAWIESITLSKAIFKIDLIVTNPGNSPVKIQKFEGEIYYNTSKIGDINQPFNILARGGKVETKIPSITITSDTSNLILQILESIASGNMGVITIKGMLTADGIKFPVDEKIQLTDDSET